MEKKKKIYKYTTKKIFLACLHTHKINAKYSEYYFIKQTKMVFINRKGDINSCLGNN